MAEAKTKKYRLAKSVIHNRRIIPAGDEVALTDEQAEQLQKTGHLAAPETKGDKPAQGKN